MENCKLAILTILVVHVLISFSRDFISNDNNNASRRTFTGWQAQIPSRDSRTMKSRHDVGTTILQNVSSKRTSRFFEREENRRKRNSTEQAGRGNEDEFEKKLEGRPISRRSFLSPRRFALVNFCSALDDLYATIPKWKSSPWSHQKLARLYDKQLVKIVKEIGRNWTTFIYFNFRIWNTDVHSEISWRAFALKWYLPENWG